jgi:transposase
LVKKLLQQRRRAGDVRPQHYRSGRKPGHVARQQHQLRTLVEQKPDLTLKELRAAAGLNCTLPAIHYVLLRLGLTYKKKTLRASKQARPEIQQARRHWQREQARWDPARLSSSMSQGRKRI